MFARRVIVLAICVAAVTIVLFNRDNTAAPVDPAATAAIPPSTTAGPQPFTTPSATVTTAPSPEPTAAGPFPHPLTDADLQAILDQDSDLDATQRLQLSRLGAQIIYADLTTTGATELARTWPELWPSGPPTRATVTDFRLNAISARTETGGGFLITAIYSGTDTRTGEPITRATSTLRAVLRPDGYRPIAP